MGNNGRCDRCGTVLRTSSMLCYECGYQNHFFVESSSVTDYPRYYRQDYTVIELWET